jgi:hypothetical protein
MDMKSMKDMQPIQGGGNIQPTEQDGIWIGEALDGVLPSEFDSRVWVQEASSEVDGKMTNRFRMVGQNLTVLATVSPITVKNSDEKQVGYHVIAYRQEGDKLKSPNDADIHRVRETFFARELTGSERAYEGRVGESKAYHIMSVFTWKPIIILGSS